MALGKVLFTNTCQPCHGNPAFPKAPKLEALTNVQPRSILNTLDNGKMRQQAKALSEKQREAIAQYVSQKLLKETIMPKEAYTTFGFKGGNKLYDCSGWGGNLAATNYRTAVQSGITRDNIDSLELKWSFAFPDASEMRSKPSVAGDWLITGNSQSGDVYAINRFTGKLGWHVTASNGIRSGIVVDKQGDSYTAYFADALANVYAVDVRKGKILWNHKRGLAWRPRWSAHAGRRTSSQTGCFREGRCGAPGRGSNGYAIDGGARAHTGSRSEMTSKSDGRPVCDPTLTAPPLRLSDPETPLLAIYPGDGLSDMRMLAGRDDPGRRAPLRGTPAASGPASSSTHWAGPDIPPAHRRSAAGGIMQLLLGNIGRPGGGILAMRGHSSIQGSTDVATLYDVLPGDPPQPEADETHETLDSYVASDARPPVTTHFRERIVSLLKAWYGDAARPENDYRYGWLPRIECDHSQLPTFNRMSRGELKGDFLVGQNPGRRRPERGAAPCRPP